MSLSLHRGAAEASPKIFSARRVLFRPLHAAAESMLRRLGDGLATGSIQFVLPDGREISCRAAHPGPDVVMRFQSYGGIFRLLSGGYIGLGEGYVAGDWTTPSLRALFDFGLANRAILEKRLAGASAVQWLNKVLRFARRNSVSGSRRNIAFHYDLGNAFYETWLDPSMTYSSGLFETDTTTLEQAQDAKYRRIVERLGIKPHHRVLEVGCGWGGFAEFAAHETGAHVTAITISREQYAYAVDRIARAGLQDRVEIKLMDYRALSGSYDRVVSIEMLEAVGEAYWPDYFGVLNRSLAPGGRAMVQVITVPDDRFAYYRSESDFIQRHIFPGGMLLSPGEMDRQADAVGLGVADAFFFGRSYGVTLDRWYDRFNERWADIEKMGFDERFRRLWTYYLTYTSAGFYEGTIDVGQFLLTKPR